MGLIQKYLNSSIQDFWSAVEIYHQSPNSINKQVLYSEELCKLQLEQEFSNETLKKFQAECQKNSLIDPDVIDNIFKSLNYLNMNFISTENNIFHESSGIFLTVRKIIPKPSSYMKILFYEFCYLDINATKAVFFTHCVDCRKQICDKVENLNGMIIMKYKELTICYDNYNLLISYNNDIGERGINWINSVLCDKFIKLISSNHDRNKKVRLDSKCLVPSVQYYELYEKMKSKYGKYLVDNWPEKTDPKKYVYEDIGIATYLMLLWNGGNIPDSNTKKIKFEDLGCGNGLLVYILNSEGHDGVGLDIRKRNIWDLYPSSVKLKVQTIIPSSSCVHPEADWLIGNHSDELTAWIPILAKMSNSHCQYFVLPCCPFNLNGEKLARKNSGLSSYEDFVNYTRNVSEICDFETYTDRLRIPSTKRICLVGYRKEVSSNNNRIFDFIKKECQNLIIQGDEWNINFKPRDSVEPVRNCTKIPKQIIDEILIAVSKRLLSDENICEVESDGGNIKKWNLGGKLSVNEIAQSIPQQHLNILKSECKGLQTLLKNHHYVYQVVKGYVQFRHPNDMAEISKRIKSSSKEMKWKEKKCWFYSNHPDGCPLRDENCSYKHKT